MNFTQSFQDMVGNVVAFIPRALAFLAILIIGWIVAKVIGRLVGKLLHKVGLDRLGERSGLRRFTGKYELSAVLGKVIYYTLLLFTLQLAFGAFGDNPVSDLLTQLVAWIPLLFVALLLVVVAFAVANAVYSLVSGMLSETSYGKTVARICQGAIVFFGAVAALGQVGIATTVTTPIMWTVLAIVAGVAIVGVGGGLIGPMRQRWERMLDSAESEAGRMKGMRETRPSDATRSMSRTYSSERYGAETNTQVREPMPPTGTPAASPAAGEGRMGERGMGERGRGEGTQGRIDPTTR